MTSDSQTLTYEQSGVSETSGVLEGLLSWVNRTLPFRKGRTGDSCLDIGFYANVLDLGHGMGLAFSTDGVGTKILVAEMMDRYDTIGIDCVAMNVNDLICVGAEPLAMLDYIAVESADPRVLESVGKGLFEGAREANISIPGGELAQLGSMIRGLRPGSGLDLVGTCVGLVRREGRMLIGQDTREGDVILGMASSGVHSNGFTLAREALFSRGGLDVSSRHGSLPGTVGEALLEPTRIYVRPCLDLIENLPGLRALAHITSDGLLNLLRIPGSFRYRVTSLPEAPPIFQLIQQLGNIAAEEMFRVFNMGIGMCAVVAAEDAGTAAATCARYGLEAWLIGHIERSPEPEVVIEPHGLRGAHGTFTPAR